MSITEETRRESYHNLERATINKRIISILEDGSELTASEVAFRMYHKKYIPFPVRQAVAPRLTEMELDGIVKVVGKKRDIGTGRNVAVYRLVRE